MKKRIFLDYAAGKDNPNAIYKEGREARARLEVARAKIAKVLSVATDEIYFSANATQLFTACSFGQSPQSRRDEQLLPHIVTTLIEHSSVLEVFRKLECLGAKVTYLKPDHEGFVTAKQVQEALQPDTRLISIMYANNEIGTIQPIKEISRMLRLRKKPPPKTLAISARERIRSLAPVALREGIPEGISFNPLLHSDCVQAPGLLPIDMQSLGVDMASFSAPKFGGPAGIGFDYIRRGTPIELPRDSGPIDLAEQMAEVLEKANKLTSQKAKKLASLRDYFIDQMLTWLPGLQVNGSRVNRLANNANFVFPIEAELIVLELDAAGVAASAGAACSSGECEEGSHVILALGKSKREALSSVRFSLGGETSKSQLDYVIKILPKIINKRTNLWQTK